LSADDTWRVWDMAGAPPRALPAAAEAVTEATFAPDGAWLAVAAGAALRPCAGADWRCPGLDGPATPAALAFAPDGRWLAAGGADGRIRLWSLPGLEARDLAGHEGRVLALSWAQGGRTFASASDDRTVRVWDVDGGAGRILVRQADALGYV